MCFVVTRCSVSLLTITGVVWAVPPPPWELLTQHCTQHPSQMVQKSKSGNNYICSRKQFHSWCCETQKANTQKSLDRNDDLLCFSLKTPAKHASENTQRSHAFIFERHEGLHLEGDYSSWSISYLFKHMLFYSESRKWILTAVHVKTLEVWWTNVLALCCFDVTVFTWKEERWVRERGRER